MKLLLAICMLASYVYPDLGEKPKAPSYVMVTVRAGSISSTEGMTMYSTRGWIHDYTEVDSPQAAVEILNEGNGTTWSVTYSNRKNGYHGGALVGLWRLDDRNKIEIEHKAIEHKKKIRIEDEAWEEHVWSVGE